MFCVACIAMVTVPLVQVSHSACVVSGRTSSFGVCPACGGKGESLRHWCKTCGGQGRAARTRNLRIKIPAGLHS